ncbi:MAG: methyltransferase domain-containing protein [Planctomycetota bacterium]|nr:MAG: methyltransferase domain-containing protein [Planctomycetota bacterium]
MKVLGFMARRRSDLVVPHGFTDEPDFTLRVPDAEFLLVQEVDELEVDELEVESALCSSLGRGQLAAHLATLDPQSKVSCYFLDQFLANDTITYHEGKVPNLRIVCDVDLPPEPVEFAALPVSIRGEAELNRDFLQQMHARLVPGGMLLAAVDNREDTWLCHELEKIFRSIARMPKKRGVVYRCVKEGELKRPRDLRCEFAFRDEGRLIHAVSRPGVFSHRSIDLGARAILETMSVHPGEKILDMGCGAGVIALAAAQRAEGVRAVGLDSNARAVQCLIEGAALNNSSNVTAVLNATGDVPDPGTFDLFSRDQAPAWSRLSSKLCFAACSTTHSTASRSRPQ